MYEVKEHLHGNGGVQCALVVQWQHSLTRSCRLKWAIAGSMGSRVATRRPRGGVQSLSAMGGLHLPESRQRTAFGLLLYARSV